MSTKHTPGPWEVMPPRVYGNHWGVGKASVFNGRECTFFIAKIDNGAPGDTLYTEEANARLIAAAPDLLAACKRVVASYDQSYIGNNLPIDTTRLADVREAIAKAEGG